MFILTVENKNKATLKLTQNESKYQVVGIEGFQPPSATINTSDAINMDGARYKSSYLNIRNVVLFIKINGNVEENRLRLYEFLGTNNYCKIYFSNNTRNVYCEGYVETVENDLFSNSQTVQVSIVCPNPYLFELNKILIDISKTFAKFEFPFMIEESGIEVSAVQEFRETSIINTGEATTGAEFTLTVDNGTVTNPTIYNAKNNAFLRLNTKISQGEIIAIDTNVGKKSIKKYIGAKEENIINLLDKNSTWHQLDVGVNVFTYSAESNENSLHITISYNNLYKGV